MKNAYFAGGCFWCIAAEFTGLPGVEEITEGYAGGDKADPTYLEVKSQRTAHRETIRVLYDESRLSYEELLDFFIDHVDPFDAGGQFIDRGLSYTLAVFWQDEGERLACERKLAAVEAKAGKPACVSLLPYTSFYRAEEEHHDYARKNPEAFAEEYRVSGRADYFERKG